MKRVCILCESWESGGIEAFITNVIRHIDHAGLEIDIVAARVGKSVFTASLQACGIRFYQLSGSTRRIGENRRRFRRLLEERRYDVVHLNAYQALSLAYLSLAGKAGVPVRIAHSHNTQLRKSPARPLKLGLHRWASVHYQNVMTDRWACSEAAARFLFGSAMDWRFIPNGINARRFQFNPEGREAARRELGLEGKLVIGNIGRLCYQKNQDFLLDVFAQVVKQNPNSRLLLVGGGEDLPKLEERAEQLGIADKVLFYGTSSHIERLLWAMDIFVLPSRFEGLPVTSVEAQAAGLPCLFSDAITRECRIGEHTWFLPLDDPPEKWVEIMMRAKWSANRTEGAVAVQAAGFDAAETAGRIARFYLRMDKHECS